MNMTIVIRVNDIEDKIQRLIFENSGKSFEEQLITQYEIEMLEHLAQKLRMIEPNSVTSKIHYMKREGYRRALKEYLTTESNFMNEILK